MIYWTCKACGFNGGKAGGIPLDEDQFPVHCICGESESLDQFFSRKEQAHLAVWAVCRHRGAVIGKIDASKAGCGCPSSLVEVFRCNLLEEPVLKMASQRCEKRIREAVPDYRGRVCRSCSFAAIHVLTESTDGPLPSTKQVPRKQSQQTGLVTEEGESTR